MLKFINGVITDFKIPGVKFAVDLIPKSNMTSRPQHVMKPQCITIHNTGNPGASAEAHTKYVDTATGYVSWHFTVGDRVIFQELPTTESAWHAGDGTNGTGNRKSIGIEICEVNNAESTAIKFIAELCKATGIKTDCIVPHKRWSGKNCPRLILPYWDSFVNKIDEEIENMNEQNNVSQIKNEKRYNTLADMPQWLVAEIKPLVDAGIINGKNTGLDLSDDMCRTIIFCKRMIEKNIKTNL